jgi:signal transduction histidine kinase
VNPSAANSILVVDDTLDNLRLLSSVLGERGYEARPATSGRQALEAARRAPPDLILLDVNMPEMDGFEVCAELKSTESLREVPVIFLTALGDTVDKVKAFGLGGADYVTKPFQIDELLARVRAHLSLRQAQVELKQSYQRLRELEKLRDDLVHMVVHDMRAPLTALTSRLEFLASDLGPTLTGPSADDLKASVRAAEGLSRMTNELLDVSRLEEGKLPLDRKPADLCALAAEVRGNLAGMERGRSIELEAAAPVRCVCDGALVKRVIENLVSNAIKHTPSGSGVRISLAGAGPRVRVAVQDSGPGVAPEARAKIFEKFGAVAARKDQTYHSAGLGLAFCKLAVEAHGGAIGVEQGQPKGAVFWFELPAS